MTSGAGDRVLRWRAGDPALREVGDPGGADLQDATVLLDQRAREALLLFDVEVGRAAAARPLLNDHQCRALLRRVREAPDGPELPAGELSVGLLAKEGLQRRWAVSSSAGVWTVESSQVLPPVGYWAVRVGTAEGTWRLGAPLTRGPISTAVLVRAVAATLAHAGVPVPAIVVRQGLAFSTLLGLARGGRPSDVRRGADPSEGQVVWRLGARVAALHLPGEAGDPDPWWDEVDEDLAPVLDGVVEAVLLVPESSPAGVTVVPLSSDRTRLDPAGAAHHRLPRVADATVLTVPAAVVLPSPAGAFCVIVDGPGDVLLVDAVAAAAVVWEAVAETSDLPQLRLLLSPATRSRLLLHCAYQRLDRGDGDPLGLGDAIRAADDIYRSRQMVEAVQPVASLPPWHETSTQLPHLRVPALAVVEALLAGRSHDVDLVAAALTCYRLSQMTADRRPHPAAAGRINRLVTSWCFPAANGTGPLVQPRQPTRLQAGAWSTAALVRLRELVRHAPWLVWCSDVEPFGEPPRWTAAEVVWWLALGVPRCTFHGAGGHSPVWSFQPSWSNHLGGPGRYQTVPGAELDDQQLRCVVDLTERIHDGADSTLLDWLHEHAHRVPPDYVEALEQLFLHFQRSGEGQVGHLAVVHDATRSGACRIAVVNLGDEPVSFVFQDSDGRRSIRMGRLNVERDDTAGYMQVFDARSGEAVSVSAGDEDFPIALTARPRAAPTRAATTSAIAISDFQGRVDELRELQDGLARRSATTGFIISGNRQVGKSTLASVAVRSAHQAGVLGHWAAVDCALAMIGRDRPLEALTRAISRALRPVLARAGLREPEVDGDPLEHLAAVDDELVRHDALPIGLVLDELDVTFHHPPGSTMRYFVERLGSTSFARISLIGTVQRHLVEKSQFRPPWKWLDLAPDLTWADGVRYFSGVDRLAPGAVLALDRPFVTAKDFREVVWPAVRGRAAYWAHLWDVLERRTSTRPGGPAHGLVGLAEHLAEATANLVETSFDLARVLEPTAGMSTSDVRRQDLFSTGEQVVLHVMAERHLRGIDISAARVAADAAGFPGAVAVQELIARGHLLPDGDQVRLRLGVYGQYLARNRNLLADVLERQGVPLAAVAAAVTALQAQPSS